MGPSKFVAPRTVDNLQQVSKALRDVQESLDLLSRGSYQLGLQTSDFAPFSPSYNRVSPPVGGMRVVLPRPSNENGGQPITFAIENPQGNLVVFASNGTKVNGAATATLSAPGIVTFISNGVDQWASTAQLPGPAGVPTVANAGLQGPPGMDVYDQGEGFIIPGQPGAPGADGAAGADGKFGVLIADVYDQGEGFIIPGPAGAQGGQGLPGADGAQGVMGRPGADGADGADGLDGAPGRAGVDGAQGVAGANGTPAVIMSDVYDTGEPFIIPGPAGAAGSAGTNGTNGAAGAQGAPGAELSYDTGEPILSHYPPTTGVQSTTSLMVLSGISGNQGTVDITTLACGGTVSVSAPAANWSIEGFTSTPEKPDGFWFYLIAPNSTSFIGVLFDEDATATTTDRLRTPTNDNYAARGSMTCLVHRSPATVGGSTRWRVNPGSGAVMTGSDGVNPVNSIDVGQGGSDPITISCAAASGAVNITSGLSAGITCVTRDFTATASGGTMQLTATSSPGILATCSTLHVDSGAGGVNGGFVQIQESASSTPTVAAADGMIWVQDLAPNQAMFTDDVNADWPLNNHTLSTLATTVTVSGITVTDLISATMPANTSRVGTTYKIELVCQYSKSTAVSTTSPTFLIAIAGTSVASITLTQQAAGTGNFELHIIAFLSVRAIGAAGVASYGASIMANGPTTQAAGTPTGAQATATATLATTAAQTIAVRTNLALAIGGHAVTAFTGTITKVA